MDSRDFPHSPPRAWAEIDHTALRHNLGIALSRGGQPVMAVVKAGAYGHGLEDLAATLAREPGVAFLGVANVGEARRITHAGVRTPIYILGPTWGGEREEIARNRWVPCISSLDEARHFDALARATGTPLSAHVAVDTGMGRGGFLAATLPECMAELDRLDFLQLDGLGSHLPSADEDRAFTLGQCASYEAVVAATGGIARWKWRHLCNSAGLLDYPQGCCNLTRPGLMLYGISPIPTNAALRPVMTLKSRVTLVRDLPAGHGVSYGRTYVTTRRTRVATLGIGYGDGFPRSVSGQGGEVWLRGRRAPILGRVTMDQTMIDVSAIPDASPGDEVEVIGAHIPVAEVASKAGTIAWEVLTRITARVTRIHRDP